MGLSDFQKIAKQAAPLSEHLCLHLMGEPLLHPEFKSIIETCKDLGTQIYLVTNGVKLKPALFDLLIDPIFYQINFSLHSYLNNFPGKDFSDYLENIFNFTELAQQKRPDLYINYRLWNLQEIQGQNSGNLAMLASIEKKYQFQMDHNPHIKQKKSYKIKNRLYMHFDTEFIWPNLDLPEQGTDGSCYGLQTHFGILADGTVVPCCLDKEGQIPLGNALETELIEILKSDRAQKMIQGFKKRHLVEKLCQHCPYIERFKN